MQCVKQNNNYICFCTVHEYFSKSYYLLFEFVAMEIQRLKQGFKTDTFLVCVGFLASNYI